MKKIVTLVAGMLFVGSAVAQSIWTNPITGTNPNTSNPYTTGDVVDPNMTASGIGRGTGITGTAATNRYNASGWNSASLDANDYFEFTLTPNSGCHIDFTSFVYTGQTSASGPASFAFRSSADGFTSDIGTPTNTGTTISLAGASYQGIASAITFRLYGWGGTNATGTFSINDFTFNGATSCGATCTPPATQASVFSSSSVTNTTATVSWTPGSSGNAIVVVHAGSAVNADPANGTSYTANPAFGSGSQIGTGNYVVYNGTGSSVNVTGLNPGTTYYFAVYEYEPNAGSPCYLLTELTGNITTTGAVASCFEIESILVDGCDGGNEGKNEMVRFHVGSTPLNVADLTVTWPPTSGNAYLGICQDATTAAGVATINSTILACGYVKEPTLGVLPAGAEVILVTSTAFNPLAQSFVNLNDTIYMIFQCAGNTTGHFANYSAGVGIRPLTMSFSNPGGCSDAVSYDKSQLTMQNGMIGAQDGGAVEFTANGTATYINRGCQAPFEPLSINAGNDVSVCFNATANLTATPGSTQYSSVAWSGGTGTFGTPNALSTTYAPGAGETGTVNLVVQLNSNCGTFVRDTVAVTINPAPTPTVTANGGTSTVCSGSPITLTAGGGTSYAWNTGATTNTVTVNPTTGTVYTVTVTNSCSSTQGTFSVTVNSLPAVTATNTGAYCIGDTIRLNATAGYTYSWSGPNSFSSTSQSPFVAHATAALAGSYSVTVTDGNSCQNSTSTSVVVNTLPVIISTTPPVTITPADCGSMDGSVTGATATGAAPVTYQWHSSTGVALAATSDLTGVAGGTYYLTAIDGNSCRDSVPFTISTLNGPPVPIFAASPDVCAGGSFTLTVTNPVIGATYTWSAPGVATQTGVNLDSITVAGANATNAGPYSVEVNAGGCSNFGSVAATLVNKPSPAITGDTTFCSGGNTVLDASSSTPATGLSFQWYQGGNPITGATSSTYTATTAGNYQVLVTNGGGCDSLSTAVTVSVGPSPALTVSNPSVCVGVTPTITVSGAAAYSWSSGTTPATGDTVTVSGATAGSFTYTVTGTDSTGCISTATSTVTVNALPSIVTSTPPVVITPASCGGSDGSISGTSATGAAPVTYQWSNSSGSIIASTANLANVAGGVYYFIATDNIGCRDSVPFTVTTLGGPPTPTFVSTPTVCPGSGFSLEVSNAIAGADYSWTSPGNPTQSGTDLDSIYISNASASNIGPYTVEMAVGGCSSFATISATLAPVPNAAITGAASFCQGSNTVLNVSGPLAGSTTIQWYEGGNPISGATSASYTVTAAGTYQVLITNAAGCDSLSAPLTVTVDSLPHVTINGMQNGLISVCNNADTLLTAGGASTYVWSNTSTTPSISYTAVTPQTIHVIGTDVNGCVDTTYLSIAVAPGPVAQGLSGTPTICNGYQTVIHVVDTIPGQTYSWSGPSGVMSTIDSVVIHTPGTYTLTETNSCGSADFPVVIGQSTIDVSFLPDTTIGLAPLPIHFTNTSSNATGFYWSFGNGDTSFLPSPSTIFQTPGTYNVFLSGSNAAYCYDTYTVQIIVLEMNVFITMPNVFSPNDDGSNDWFGVKSYGITDFSCTIYDRWGILVKELKNVNEKWTPATSVSEGTYFYIMKAKGIDKQEFEGKGTILLVR